MTLLVKAVAGRTNRVEFCRNHRVAEAFVENAGLFEVPIIDQATTDAEGHFCFGKKAIRAADHLLVSRYFDYLQVPFHKSVVALEWSLRVVIRELLNRGKISCSANEMIRKVECGEWRTFDDNVILNEARKLFEDLRGHRTRVDRDTGVLVHIGAILHRNPAKLIASYEEVTPSHVQPEVDAAQVKQVVEAFRDGHGLCDLSLHLWNPKDFALIKASTRGIGAANLLLPELTPDEPEYYELVRIDVPGKAARPISTFKEALMHQIFNFRYRAIRVYAQINNNSAFENLISKELLPKLRELKLSA